MNDTTRLFLIAVMVAVLVLGAVALWLLGADRVFTLALILVGGLVLAAVIAATAFPIRAAHKRDMTGETRILDGTRTIVRETRVLDGRAPAQNDIRLLQLPPQPQGGAWPELLRGAYQAGLLGNGRQPAERSAPADAGQDLAELDLGSGGDEWGGSIAP